jgi:RNA polymerase sigma-70 factor (ECF subfamily)
VSALTTARPNEPNGPDEAEILRQWRETAVGDRRPSPELVDAVGRLLASHQRRVYGTCFHLMGNPERASELAQETLLTAWTTLSTFRGESTLGTWLYSIARHQCFNAMRKRHELLTHDGVIEGGSLEATALAALRKHERDELLREAAAEVLDPTEQEAIHLRYVEHLPQDEITRLLDLQSGSGARGLLQRCRRKLGRELLRRLEALGHGLSFVRESR